MNKYLKLISADDKETANQDASLRLEEAIAASNKEVSSLEQEIVIKKRALNTAFQHQTLNFASIREIHKEIEEVKASIELQKKIHKEYFDESK